MSSPTLCIGAHSKVLDLQHSKHRVADSSFTQRCMLYCLGRRAHRWPAAWCAAHKERCRGRQLLSAGKADMHTTKAPLLKAAAVHTGRCTCCCLPLLKMVASICCCSFGLSTPATSGVRSKNTCRADESTTLRPLSWITAGTQFCSRGVCASLAAPALAGGLAFLLLPSYCLQLLAAARRLCP